MRHAGDVRSTNRTASARSTGRVLRTWRADFEDDQIENEIAAERAELFQEPQGGFLRGVGGKVAVAAELAQAEAEPDVLKC